MPEPGMVGFMENLETLHDLWRIIAAHGNRPGLLTLADEGMESLPFADLLRRVEEVSARLLGGGLEPGQRAVLWGPGSADWTVVCLGIIHAGGIVVPLDLQLGREALQRILADCEPRFILTTRQQQERLMELDGKVPPILFFDIPEGESSLQSLPRGRSEPAGAGSGDQAPAVLFYTSGTTGPPKGVPLTHKNLVHQINQLMASRLMRSDDRVLLPLPQHHVYPFTLGTLVPLAMGIPIIFPRSMTGPEILRALQMGKVTVIAGVPRLYRALFEAVNNRFARIGPVGREGFRGILAIGRFLRSRGVKGWRKVLAPIHHRIGPNLRLLACGGAPLDPALARNLEALGWDIAIGYGLTETSPLLTMNLPDAERRESVGKPLPGVEIRLADIGRGEAGGEVQVKGANVFSGYWNLPEETTKAFTADGWFRTGDLGHLDHEGHLTLMGRASSLIVTESGKNVWPEEVEEAYEESPAIREIAILEQKGRLAALIVPEAGFENDERAIHEAIAERAEQLPSHHRLAEYAVTRRALPRTRLGKIRRHLLAERYEEARRGRETGPGKPLPLSEMSGEDRTLLQGRAALESWRLFTERFPEQGLTPDSHLQHDLGVDSLEWLSLTVEIGRRTGLELSEDAIAHFRTVRDLLQKMAGMEAEGRKEAFSGEFLEEPEVVLSDLQQRWLKPLPPLLLVISDLLFALNRFLLKTAFHLQVVGLENLPAEGPFVLAPNHLSSLDPLMIAAILDKEQLHRTFWAGWTGIAFGNPVARFLSRLGRAFPVDPHRAVVSSLAFGALVLKRRRNLVWFPEGERSRTGEMKSFRPGLSLLLLRYPVPVVPIYLEGSFEALPRGKLMPRLVPLRLTVGKPCEVKKLLQEGEGEKEPERIAHALQKRVAALGGKGG